MDLHYSRTGSTVTRTARSFTTLWIYTILKPVALIALVIHRFTTLWIYTILKLPPFRISKYIVSLPYGFTLFSNATRLLLAEIFVSLPYGFTLFSNL